MRMTPCGASERSLTSCAGIVVAMASQSTSAPSGDVAELLPREKQARLGRRERPYQAGMGATEDKAWRRFAAGRNRRTLPEGGLDDPEPGALHDDAAHLGDRIPHAGLQATGRVAEKRVDSRLVLPLDLADEPKRRR